MFSGFYGRGDDFIDFDGRPRYQNMAEKSAAAIRREEEAMKKFQQAREQMENRGDLVAGTKITVELLKPSCHLTEACWKTFLRHVRSFDGWVAKRRVATPEEKKQHKETRKGKVYFVDVVFSVPKGQQVMKRSVEGAQGSSMAGSSGMASGSAEDAETSSEDDDESPAEKKATLISDTSSEDEDDDAPAAKMAKFNAEYV